jgi:hypothetical protein
VNVRGDVLVNQTADGVDLNAVWDEFRDLLDVWNKQRSSLTDLLTFKTTATAQAIETDRKARRRFGRQPDRADRRRCAGGALSL